MEFREVVQTTGACRYYRPDPVPDDVLARVLDAARWAPTGGNRQGVRFLVVRDAVKRRALRDLYVPLWEQYVARAGARPGAPLPKLIQAADHMARHLDEVPVLLVVCADLRKLAAVDRDLDRYSMVGGASVYPFVWSILLAARAEGLGGVITTMPIYREPELRSLLSIPATHAAAAVVALGVPEHQPTKLRRAGVETFATIDAFDGEVLGG